MRRVVHWEVVWVARLRELDVSPGKEGGGAVDIKYGEALLDGLGKFSREIPRLTLLNGPQRRVDVVGKDQSG
jgi:hypothetical protein